MTLDPSSRKPVERLSATLVAFLLMAWTDNSYRGGYGVGVEPDPDLLAARPELMLAAAASYEAAANTVSSVGAATERAAKQLLAEWQGRGAQGFATRINHLTADTPKTAERLQAVATALRTLAPAITEAQALAHHAIDLREHAAPALSAAAHDTTLGTIRALAATDDMNTADAMTTRANATAREAWDAATRAFNAIIAASPGTQTATLTSFTTSQPVHGRPKISPDQVKLITDDDGQRVYSFDGGLKIPADIPGAHKLVEGIKSYLPRYLAGHTGDIEVPADLSPQHAWYEVAYLYIITHQGAVPRQIRDQFFTDTYSSITFKTAAGMSVLGAAGSITPAAGDNTVTGEQITKTNQGLNPTDLGAARELRVAEITGGRVIGEPGKVGLEIIEPGVGKTDVDVEGPNGEYIAVGGPAKGRALDSLASKLRILRYAANQAGVPAQAYFDDGTPESVLKVARRWLGPQNVFTFKLK